MATTGTYSFDPSTADLVLDAFARIQIQAGNLTAEHLFNASRQANLLLSQWANLQPQLWRSEQQIVVPNPLVQGTATYALLPRTVSILLANIRTGSGSSQIDRTLGPLSTTDYGSIASKNTQGPPTSFWFNRQIDPSITLYPVPDNGGPYTLILQTVSQVQDASIANGTTMDVPFRFLDAFAAGLSHRLARIYKPEAEQVRKLDATEAWAIASGNDVEDVPLTIAPNIGGYFR